jgi:GAF domain-containing protein
MMGLNIFVGTTPAAMRSGKSIIVADAQNDPNFYRNVDVETGAVTRNIIAVPLTSSHGAIGVLEVLNRRGGLPFDDDDLSLLWAVSASVTIAIQNARLYDQLRASETTLLTQVSVLRRDLARNSASRRSSAAGPRWRMSFA